MATSNKGRQSGSTSRPVTGKPKTTTTGTSNTAATGTSNTATKGTKPTIDAPVRAAVSQPRATVTQRPPLGPSTRQARLAIQKQRQTNQRIITGVFLAGLAVLVIVIAVGIYQAIPKPATPARACLTPPTNLPSTADQPPTSTLKPVAISGGLEYIDLVAGCGATVGTTSSITANYTGWVVGGKKFQSSRDSGGSPFTATLGQHQVIPGWDLGIPGMKVGGVRRLIIPAALAYAGSPPASSGIPVNANLVFDISLISSQ